MPESLATALPPPQRIAISYAKASVRAPLLALLAFDARLGQVVRQANEPIAGQMRLAWWREQLRLDAERRERSDELVVALDLLAGMRHSLVALVEGWELLLAERLGLPEIENFAAARAQAFVAVAKLVEASDREANVAQAARTWALADLAAGVSMREEREAVLEMAARPAPGGTKLSRRLRPLAILEGLARRGLAQGGSPLLDGPASLLLAMRLGLLGS